MSTKTDTLEQHNMLHQYWLPPHCCLCGAEARIRELEEAIKRLEEKLEEKLGESK